ncbi:MAG: hypothetical protein MK441_13050 [SAR324 cluster bacterium]|nr:hypothetical protein [SAR324 cluster bacterium]
MAADPQVIEAYLGQGARKLNQNPAIDA